MDPAPRKAVRVLSCPNCGGAMTLRAPGSSVSAICSSCGSTIDVANETLRVIAVAQAKTRTPAIPIGTRAALVGVEWEVVGYQERSDPGPGWRWSEYLLFNPYEGFRFLVHDEADWTLYAMLRQDVPDPASGVGDGREYRHLRTGQARTNTVIGEFYWRVRTGDTVEEQEFESHPFLLSREQGGNEVTWSRGVQLPAATVRTAFGLERAVVPATAVDHLARRRAGTRIIWLTFAASVMALVVFRTVSFDRFHAAPVFHQAIVATKTDMGHPIMSGPFEVPAPGGNLAIEAGAPVSNSWIQLGWSLVDQATQRSFNAMSTVEEYNGEDSDGAWTEGGQSAQVVFRSIPGGTYRLLIDVDAKAFEPQSTAPGNGTPPQVRVDVTVIRHVPSGLNFWLALLVLLPYPMFRWLVNRATRPGAELAHG